MATQKSKKDERLTPRKSTERRLYMYSGNVCAFPDCNYQLQGTDKIKNNNYIGEIAHIEGANEGSPRYNPNLSLEDRRSYDNLILLCPTHHKETNDETIYSVKVLKEMKKNHEFKIKLKLEDDEKKEKYIISDIMNFNPPKNLIAINKKLNWGLNRKELKEVAVNIQRDLKLLLQLSIRSRIILWKIILISKSNEFYAIELADAHNLTPEEFNFHVEALKIKGILDGPYEATGNVLSDVYCLKSFSDNLWSDLIAFCGKDDEKLGAMIVKLDFTHLDK